MVDGAAARSRTGKAIDATEHAGEKGVDVAEGAAHTTSEKATDMAGAAAKKTQEVAGSPGHDEGTVASSTAKTLVGSRHYAEVCIGGCLGRRARGQKNAPSTIRVTGASWRKDAQFDWSVRKSSMTKTLACVL